MASAVLEEILTEGAASTWLAVRAASIAKKSIRKVEALVVNGKTILTKTNLKTADFRKWIYDKSANLTEVVKKALGKGRDLTIYADKFIQSQSQIQQKILANLNNTNDAGRKMSAVTAQKLKNDGVTITDLDNTISSNEVRPFNDGQPNAGDRDLATPNYLIECKVNLSRQSVDKVVEQIDKMIGVPKKTKGPLRQFMNPTNKKVIIYTEETLSGNNSVFLKQMQDYAKEWDVLIIDNYSDLLKTLKK